MNKKKLFIILVIFFVILTYPFTARAVFFEIGESIFLKINSIFIGVLGKILAWTVGVFSWIIQMQGFQNVEVVKTSWMTVRDFVNMFFILILIVVAFGTIFSLDKYSINTPGLLSRIIVAALLINFSLAIGGIIIDGSQVFTNVFLKAMGDDFAGNLASGIGINKIFGTGSFDALVASNASPDRFISGLLINSFFTLIIVAILTLSMLSAMIFSVVRIPMLWALLIVSPVAWVMGIFPGTKHISTKWWNLFIGWTLFLPVYLFMLVIGTAILKNKTQIDPLFNSFQGQSGLISLGSFIFQDVFFYILAIMILVGGLGAALKMSMFAGTGATGAFQSGKNWVERRTGVSAARTAVKEVGKRIKEEGVPGLKIGGWQPFKGEAGEKEKAARWADKLGKPFGLTPDYALQKRFMTNVDKHTEEIRNLLLAGKISEKDIAKQASDYKATDEKGAAARFWMAENGRLDNQTFAQTLRDMSEKQPFVMQKFLDSAEKGKYSNIKPEELIDVVAARGDYTDFNTEAFRRVRQRVGSFVSKEKRFKNNEEFNEEVFREGYQLLGEENTPEGREFKKGIGETRPDLSIPYEYRDKKLKGTLSDELKALPESDAIPMMMKDRFPSPKQLADMPLGAWESEMVKKSLALKVNSFTTSKDKLYYAKNLKRAIEESEDSKDKGAKIRVVDTYIEKHEKEVEDKKTEAEREKDKKRAATETEKDEKREKEKRIKEGEERIKESIEAAGLTKKDLKALRLTGRELLSMYGAIFSAIKEGRGLTYPMVAESIDPDILSEIQKRFNSLT